MSLELEAAFTAAYFLRMKKWFYILTVLLAAGCGADIEAPVETRQLALGEPIGDFPSLSERQVLYLTNRARTEPSAFNPEDPYPATPPLRWDLSLSEAARFHAKHIDEEDCWCEDHSSCCEVTEIDGVVQCAGPSTGCGVTTSEARVALFSSAYRGENMARGYPTASAAIEGWISSPGHWQNMNSGGATLLGPGHFASAWVQDFGGGGSPPIVGDGIHLASGQGAIFGATFYQPSSEGPQSALVIVNGTCHELEVAYGDASHGAFEANISLEPGCSRYYFYFRDENGNDITYPSTGSLGVSPDGSECPLFIETRPADTCSPSGQACRTGDSRACYTGPFGTRDEGICTSGFERCISGQWTGECLDEIGPEATDICGNQLDDNCDGSVDETCEEPEDVGEVDMGSAPDVGIPADADGPADTPTDPEPPSGGCSTADTTQGSYLDLLLIGLIAMMSRARRLRRTRIPE